MTGRALVGPARPLRLRVPGSTSNLGPGFDVLGLAVDRYLTAAWLPADDPLRLETSGTLDGLDPADELVSRTLAAALGCAVTDLGGVLRLHSEVPVARGLGSSATARVVGEVLAVAVRQGADGTRPRAPEESSMDAGPIEVSAEVRRRLIESVSRGEGHPDNAVPALVGGFVAAALETERVRWTPLPLSPHVGMAFGAPGIEVRTDEARGVLPAQVGHGDATANAARLAILLAGLAHADGDRIAWGLDDRLHVPWRWPLVPGAAAAADAARASGAWGVTLSGSGSGLIAFGPPERAEEMASALEAAFQVIDAPAAACAFPLRRAVVGATLILAQPWRDPAQP